MCGVSNRLMASEETQIEEFSISDGFAKTNFIAAKGSSETSVSLLELAANNDLEGFARAVEENCDKVETCRSWYCRNSGSNRMIWSQKTPAMIAALYGSLEVLQYILNHLSAHGGDINEGCEFDGVTALHCAAAGGSKNIVDVISLLLSNGADPTTVDSQGLKPLDVIRVSPNVSHLKKTVENLLDGSFKPGSPPPQEAFSWFPLESDSSSLSSSPSSPKSVADLENKSCLDVADNKCDVYTTSPPFSSSFSSSPGTGGFFPNLTSYLKSSDASMKTSSDSIEKDSGADPSLSCMKNSMYLTDEFRMFSFKVCPCSRAYSHDWTECPFVHPGENARRRDPRMYHYSCVPCPEFRKGACRRGDACEYAHGVFECWLHPAQYRTRLCKDGANCSRKVCFFAHAKEELRAVHPATGSAALSLRAMDVPSSDVHLGSTSSPSTAVLSSLSAQQSGVSTPTMSSFSINPAGNRTQLGSPTAHHSGIGSLSSRLKAASSARDALLDDFSRPPPGFEEQFLSEVTSLSTRARLNAAVAASGCGTTSNIAGKFWSNGSSVLPTNLEDFLINDVTSPAVSPQPIMQMPSNKSLISSYQSKSSQTANQVMLANFKQMQASKGTAISPAVLAARSILAQRDKRCHSSKDLGQNLSWSDWGSPTGKPEWGVHADDLSKFRKSASFGIKTSEEPDLSWVQGLLKDGPSDGESLPSATAYPVEMGYTGLRNMGDRPVLRSWMEQKQLDQIVA